MCNPKDEEVSRSAGGLPQPEGSEPRCRPGLPDEASILGSKIFKSPRGKKYRIIKTRERDPYDPPAADETKK
jgi:hypothetical protein